MFSNTLESVLSQIAQRMNLNLMGSIDNNIKIGVYVNSQIKAIELLRDILEYSSHICLIDGNMLKVIDLENISYPIFSLTNHDIIDIIYTERAIIRLFRSSFVNILGKEETVEVLTGLQAGEIIEIKACSQDGIEVKKALEKAKRVYDKDIIKIKVSADKNIKIGDVLYIEEISKNGLVIEKDIDLVAFTQELELIC